MMWVLPFFNPESEEFTSIPYNVGSEIQNGAMQFFEQYSDNIIIRGSAVSGLYYLRCGSGEKNTYTVRQFTEQSEIPITNSRIRFVHSDSDDNIWIGTAKGLNFITKKNLSDNNPVFIHKFTNTSFTAICETSEEIWFGTENEGIIVYDKLARTVRNLNKSDKTGLLWDMICSSLYISKNRMIIAGLKDNGIEVTDKYWFALEPCKVSQPQSVISL